MKLIKRQSKQTYTDKNGKERHYYNYYLVTDNDKSIQIKPSFHKDIYKLDMISSYDLTIIKD